MPTILFLILYKTPDYPTLHRLNYFKKLNSINLPIQIVNMKIKIAE